QARVLFFKAGKPGEALAKIDTARKLAGTDLEMLGDVSYTEALIRAFQGDYKNATRLIEDIRDRAGREGEADIAATLSNTATWLHWGMDDLDAALAQNERLREALESGHMFEEDSHRYLLHYWWDKAYLLLERAMGQRDAKGKAAGLAEAEDARTVYK